MAFKGKFLVILHEEGVSQRRMTNIKLRARVDSKKQTGSTIKRSYFPAYAAGMGRVEAWAVR